jgi:hypothetical protein
VVEPRIMKNDHDGSRKWQAESIIEMIFDDLISCLQFVMTALEFPSPLPPRELCL